MKRECLDVCLAARQFDEWLGLDGIAGGEIKGKAALSIESKLLETTDEVEEIRDSEGKSDSEGEDADGRVEIAQL